MPHKLVNLWNSIPTEDKDDEAVQIVYTEEEAEEEWMKGYDQGLKDGLEK